MCLFFLKKSLHVLIQPSELHWTFWPKPLFWPNCACDPLIFSTKAFMYYVLNFFEKKPSCAYSLPRDVLIFIFFYSTKVFMCYVLNFFEKSLHVLIGPCAYKKMSVYLHSTLMYTMEISKKMSVCDWDRSGGLQKHDRNKYAIILLLWIFESCFCP